MPVKKLVPADQIELLVTRSDNAKIQRREIKRVAKELRHKQKAEVAQLQRNQRGNTSYTAKIKGGSVHVVWNNGNQYCSLIESGEAADAVEEVVEKTPKLPSTKMTWKKLRAEVVAGNIVYNKQGKKIPCTKRAEEMPNKEVNVTTENSGKTKIYRIV